MTAGVPSFVVQEEFDRYTGYWWEPDTKKSNHYRILYEEVDESEVEILSIFSPSDVKGVDEYRYPRAGLYDFEGRNCFYNKTNIKHQNDKELFNTKNPG